MRRMVGFRGVGAVLGLVSFSACAVPLVMHYRASPVADRDWGDRLHLERDGVRVLAGPPAAFPYVRVGVEGKGRESGRYQLFTRVMVENVGRDEVRVLWDAARLEGPDGGSIRLLDSRSLWVEGGRPPTSEGEEALLPGERSVRALLPETVLEIEADEPMVPLCHDCEYHLIVPVRVGGRVERLDLGFRLEAERPPVRRFRWFRGSP